MKRARIQSRRKSDNGQRVMWDKNNATPWARGKSMTEQLIEERKKRFGENSKREVVE